jgi:hypothetical protein
VNITALERCVYVTFVDSLESTVQLHPSAEHETSIASRYKGTKNLDWLVQVSDAVPECREHAHVAMSVCIVLDHDEINEKHVHHSSW